MPRFGGPSSSPSVPNRPELERELTVLEGEVRDLEALPPADRVKAQPEIDRKKAQISTIRRKLG